MWSCKDQLYFCWSSEMKWNGRKETRSQMWIIQFHNSSDYYPDTNPVWSNTPSLQLSYQIVVVHFRDVSPWKVIFSRASRVGFPEKSTNTDSNHAYMKSLTPFQTMCSGHCSTCSEDEDEEPIQIILKCPPPSRRGLTMFFILLLLSNRAFYWFTAVGSETVFYNNKCYKLPDWLLPRFCFASSDMNKESGLNPMILESNTVSGDFDGK